MNAINIENPNTDSDPMVYYIIYTTDWGVSKPNNRSLIDVRID